MSEFTIPRLESQDGLFPALLAGLAEFDARVDGTCGRHRERISSIGSKPGTVRTTIIRVLETLGEVLVGLRDTIAYWSVQTDALLAMLEIFGLGLQGLGDLLDDPSWPEPMFGLPDQPLPSMLPSDATLTAIITQIEALVGPADQPEAGSLTQLRNDLAQ